MKITSKIVKDLHRYMARVYKFKIIDKADAAEMRLVAQFIGRFIMMKDEDFLKRFATTIGDRVYLPYTPGEGSKYQLFKQICTITHEARHVYDFRRHPWEMGTYLFSKSSRTESEFRAYSTYLYLYWWRYGRLPNMTALARKIRVYGCDSENERVLYGCLRMTAPIVKRGHVANSVAKRALRWLKRRCK